MIGYAPGKKDIKVTLSDPVADQTNAVKDGVNENVKG